jgi:predicted amidophosphoribosyltransferase
MAKCPRCGHNLDIDAGVCFECGYRKRENHDSCPECGEAMTKIFGDCGGFLLNDEVR